mmetsp:Transcript_9775/g.29733  ORF Transcript_9775/g.29733 Transcript_9775/m.29733 type:complete len:246 (+) Transcript_9775:731-1468(+)
MELPAAHDVVPARPDRALAVTPHRVGSADGEGLVGRQVAHDHPTLRGDNEPGKPGLDGLLSPRPQPVKVEEVLLHGDGLLHGHHQLGLVPAVYAPQNAHEELVVVLMAEDDGVAVVIRDDGLAVLPQDPRSLVLDPGRAAQRGAQGPAILAPTDEPAYEDAALVARPRARVSRAKSIQFGYPRAVHLVHGFAVDRIAPRPHVLQVDVPPRAVLIPANPRVRVVDPEQGVRLADLNGSGELLVLAK